jgi:hypothetical protein
MGGLVWECGDTYFRQGALEPPQQPVDVIQL